MMIRISSTAAVALLLAGTAAPALAQDAWTGPYLGLYGSFGQANDQEDERLRFDRNLDGNFGELVTTTTNADAFSPGSCDGAANTAVAADGCDDDGDLVEAGVRVGYDFQFGSFVVGAVVEYSEINAEDSVTSFTITPAAYTFERKLDNLAAVRARVGYAYGPALFYGTAGGVTGEMANQFVTSNNLNSFTTTANDDQADGYQAGGGIEYRLAGNFSVTGEYLYTSLDAPEFTVRFGRGAAAATNPFVLAPNTTGTDVIRSNSRFGLHAFRLGMNYRF